MSAIKPVMMNMHLLLVNTFFSNGIVKNNFFYCVVFIFNIRHVEHSDFYEERSSLLKLSFCERIFSIFFKLAW